MDLVLPKSVRRGWTGAFAPREAAFPFGLGRAGVHEIAETSHGERTVCSGFAAAGLASYGRAGAVVWIQQTRARVDEGALSGAGLAAFGLNPSRLILIEARKTIDALWAAEEAARSGAVSAIVAEIDDLDFTQTRRLALVSKEAGVPILLCLPYVREGATAADARWRLEARPAAPNRFDPRAPGRPRWRATLERSRSSPASAGYVFDLEYDHETVSLRVVSGLAAGPAPPHAPGAEDRVSETVLRDAG